ncbi:MAG: hypothetical protein ACYDGR_16240 [Candidatus Dormibacteria bacterium]
MIPTPNQLRWKVGRPGHYEGWFVVLNEPEAGRGFWIRYSLRAPSDGSKPTCQLWFMRSDRGREPANRACRVTLPVSAMTENAAPWQLNFEGSAGSGHLSDTGCSGSIEAEGVEWQLTFETRMGAVQATPEWGARISTAYSEAHPLMVVRGSISEAGHTIHVNGLLGSQAHVFGKRHSPRWHWAECRHLGRADAVFIGVSAWPQLPGPRRALTSLLLDLGATTPWTRNRTLHMLGPRTAHDPAGWVFSSTVGRSRLSGSVRPRRADLVGVTYHDPDGTAVYCYHSELSDLELRLERRARASWVLHEEILAPGAAAFEYGSRTPLTGVPLLLD